MVGVRFREMNIDPYNIMQDVITEHYRIISKGLNNSNNGVNFDSTSIFA